MLAYLADDRGARGEYSGFLKAHERHLPPLDIRIFSSWTSLRRACDACVPDLFLLDMRFDCTPPEELCGNVRSIAESDIFAGNAARAEEYVRAYQGLLIVKALRAASLTAPIILFGSLVESHRRKLYRQHAPVYLLDGLLLDELHRILCEISEKSGV